MSNTGITLVDVRAEAMDAIKQLKGRTMNLPTANSIKGLLDTIVSVAKTQVEFLKVLPPEVRNKLRTEEVKAIAGTLQDRDADLDLSLHEIKENQEKVYS